MDAFAEQLRVPRAAWVVVPAGEPTDQTVFALAERFESGDIIIDGGNSYFKDDVRRAGQLAEKGIHYVDVGTSGGVWGIDRGYYVMIGGQKDVTVLGRARLAIAARSALGLTPPISAS